MAPEPLAKHPPQNRHLIIDIIAAVEYRARPWLSRRAGTCFRNNKGRQADWTWREQTIRRQGKTPDALSGLLCAAAAGGMAAPLARGLYNAGMSKAQRLEQSVRVPADGGAIAGDLSLPGDAAAVVLFAHGSGSSRHSPRNRAVGATLQRGGPGPLEEVARLAWSWFLRHLSSPAPGC